MLDPYLDLAFRQVGDGHVFDRCGNLAVLDLAHHQCFKGVSHEVFCSVSVVAYVVDTRNGARQRRAMIAPCIRPMPPLVLPAVARQRPLDWIAGQCRLDPVGLQRWQRPVARECGLDPLAGQRRFDPLGVQRWLDSECRLQRQHPQRAPRRRDP